RRVLQLRFGLEDGRSRTLEEVGRDFNVTRERIRQIEAKALRKLGHPSRRRILADWIELKEPPIGSIGEGQVSIGEQVRLRLHDRRVGGVYGLFCAARSDADARLMVHAFVIAERVLLYGLRPVDSEIFLLPPEQLEIIAAAVLSLGNPWAPPAHLEKQLITVG